MRSTIVATLLSLGLAANANANANAVPGGGGEQGGNWGGGGGNKWCPTQTVYKTEYQTVTYWQSIISLPLLRSRTDLRAEPVTTTVCGKNCCGGGKWGNNNGKGNSW